MRTPLILAGPGIPAGRSTAAFTYLLDLFPTICALAGVEPPAGLAGRDLRPLWDDERAKVRESVFLPFSDLMRSVRDARWKLIVYPQINHRQLFDLRDDPHETRDLAAEPGHEPEIARLTALMRSWQKELGDEQPLAVRGPRPKEVRFDDFDRKPDEWQPAWIVEKYFRHR
jgi:arylsulfatase A-like enzyme